MAVGADRQVIEGRLSYTVYCFEWINVYGTDRWGLNLRYVNRLLATFGNR